MQSNFTLNQSSKRKCIFVWQKMLNVCIALSPTLVTGSRSPAVVIYDGGPRREMTGKSILCNSY